MIQHPTNESLCDFFDMRVGLGLGLSWVGLCVWQKVREGRGGVQGGVGEYLICGRIGEGMEDGAE